MRRESVEELRAGLLSQISSRDRGFGIQRRPSRVALGLWNEGDNYRLAVRIYEDSAESRDLVRTITDQAAGEVDVAVVGKVVAQDCTSLQVPNRPLVMGCSCAHFAERLGTLGCFVTLKKDLTKRAHILSNNHVLAKENLAQPGQNILQPATDDDGEDPDALVAELVDFEPLDVEHNIMDAAIARLVDGVDPDRSSLLGLGRLAGLREAPLATGDTVFKVGRSTCKTEGRVRAWDLQPVQVTYGSGTDREFDHQIEIEPFDTSRFSDHGDSGALIVDKDFLAVGLLFGGSEDGQFSYANPLGPIFTRFGLTLLF